MLFAADDANDNEVDDSKGEYADNEADNAIENGILSFLNLASVARGGHVGNATDDDYNNGYDTEGSNDTINDAGDAVGKVF